MTIVFACSHFGFLRNFEPALHLLAERGHQIHLVADRKDTVGGMRTVENLVSAHPTEISYGWAPSPKKRAWYVLGGSLRLCLDYWRYLDPRYRNSPKLRARAAMQVPGFAVRLGKTRLLATGVGRRTVSGLLRALERAIPYDPSVRHLLEAQHPDVLLITPLLYFGSAQVDYVRAARALGIPTVLCVGSWDHLTTKGMIHDVPDRVTVWNEAQRQEAWELHGVPPGKVAVTGAQAYDHWFTATASVSREEFCGRIGLDPGRPILLYVCSSQFIAPYEVAFIEKWVRAIRAHSSQTLRGAGLLIRPHPQNFEQWREIDFSSYGNVAIFPRGGANPVDAAARADYFNSLYYSAAVVGVNTSALIEAGIVGRPVHTVLGEEFADTQEGTLHFHHLTGVSDGLLRVATTLDEHLADLDQALLDARGVDSNGRRFIQSFIRPRGLEVPAAPVFADVIEDVARSGVSPRPRDPLWIPALRSVLYPAAVAASAWSARRRATRRRARREPAHPLRVLFAMASPEYLRYYDSTIRLLAERGHDVVVGVNHLREKKQARLEGLETGRQEIEVVGLVPKRHGVWGRVGKGLRGLTDFVRFLHPRLASARALRARMKAKALPVAFRFLDRVPALGERSLRACLRGLAVLERSIPSGREIEAFLRRHDPDVVLVSPLIDAASDQVELVKSARALGIPSAACIASWDNLTNKGLMRVEPDRVVVWNEIQKMEAVQFHGIPPEKVAVTGAQPFDRWFERRPGRSRAEFCAMVGLVPDKPFVLYTCSSGFIAESSREVPFVRSWIRALRESGDPTVCDLSVLVRPHPYNTLAWESADLSDLGEVAVWPRQRYNAVDEVHRAAYFESLHYSVAAVGINTSAMIEAAIVGRPVFSVLTAEFALKQEGTLHFHYLLPEQGGCVRVASSFQEHVTQLASAIRDTDATRQQTRRFVQSFVRPHGLDRPCTPIVADTIEALAREKPAMPARTPVWAYPLRVVLLLAGAYAGLIAFVAAPRTIGRARKAIRTRAHRGRKALTKTVRVIWHRVGRAPRQASHELREHGVSPTTRRLRQWRRGLWRYGVLGPTRYAALAARRGRSHAATFWKYLVTGDLETKS